MTSKLETQDKTSFDWLKWIIAAALIIAGLIVNYYYNSQPWPLRLLGWLLLLLVTAVIAFQTRQGKQVIEFARESRIELRKVYWPTRQETIQMTLMIAAVVALMAVALWGVDTVLMLLIGWLTGQRG